MSDERYVRVYYSIRTDPKFESVYGDDASLAAWVRLLLDADAVWPAPASIPKSCKPAALRRLSGAGIVDVLPGGMFRVHGLDAERDKRGHTGRTAATVRWQNERSANAMRMHSVGIANAMPVPSPSPSPNRTESEQESEQDDPVGTYYVLTTRTPRGRALDWCRRLGDQYGYRATSDAMSDAWGESDEVGTLLSRTEDRLVLAGREAERRERAAELARLREKRERRLLPIDTPPDPEKVGDIMGKLREMMRPEPPTDAA
jgi:hypothetical protein